MSGSDDRPLGVFDSGVGGLTVLAAVMRELPGESTAYLGDTARVPYGTKSAAVVTRYALNNAEFLVRRGIKLLVVACNTASAVALPELCEKLQVPVIGVIEPGARRAIERSRAGVVGVIGTEGTVASGAYVQALAALDPEVVVHQRACPLFVPLAEEGWGEHPVARQVASEYLREWVRQAGLDALILGCTHYPLLVPAIRDAVGERVELVDSASAVAAEVARLLPRAGVGRAGTGKDPVHECFVTDVPERFVRVGERFLGRPLLSARQVDLALLPSPLRA